MSPNVKAPESSAELADRTAALAAQVQVLEHELLTVRQKLHECEQRAAALAHENLTTRQLAEHTTEHSARLLRTVADGLPGMISYWDWELRCRYANRAYLEWFGKSLAEVIAIPARELLGAELFRQNEPYLNAALMGRQQSFERTIRRVNGEVRYTWAQYVPDLVEGVVQGMVVLVSDITAMRQAEATRARLAAIVESTSDAIWSLNHDGLIETWNPASERLLGYRAEEVLGQSIERLIPPDQRAAVLSLQASMRRGERVEAYETGRLHKNGTLIAVRLTLSPIIDDRGLVVGASVIAHDITQRKALEAQLQKAQKLEVIGQLAGGVAHDFNNILQTLMFNLELLQKELPLPVEAQAPLQEMATGAQRAATLTAQLLMFARRQVVQLRTLELNAALTQVTGLLRHLLGQKLSIQIATSPSPLWVEADSGLLDQAVMNLCLNARDAMPSGGTLTLSTERVVFDTETARSHPDSRAGTFVCLRVSDTGCGMSADVLAHVFEPFFTTKEVGQGTGLGLASVYGIVHQHHGFVQVESTVGQGTSFRLYLPWSDKVARTEPQGPGSEPKARGTETILLVEDEEMLRRVTERMLKSQGYRVLSASDGPAALQLWEEHQGAIDLLLSDMMMPGGLTGLQLGQTLRQKNATLKILLLSGYSVDIVQSQSPEVANLAFLAKPFRLQELLAMIRRCLDYV